MAGRHRRRRLITFVTVLAVGGMLAAAAPGFAGQAATSGRLPAAAARQLATARALNNGASAAQASKDPGEAQEIIEQNSQWALRRSLPGATAPAAAFAAAQQAAGRLAASGGAWREVTHQPYNSDDPNYRDPVWSNSGGGAGLVSGRITALATDGPLVYAGGADGGVWRSTDRGGHWTPLFQHGPTIAVGALWVNPRDHSVWLGTGEANTAFENYNGQGVFRSADFGRTWRRVGGLELNDAFIHYLRPDGRGWLYAATRNGLWRHRVDGSLSAGWQLLLKPDPNAGNTPYNTSIITDVAIPPQSHGKVVLAALGWRNGSAYNGFYLSTRGGAPGSFQRITPTGDIDATDIGRVTFALSRSGDRLYAVVESPARLAAGADSVLQGVYVTRDVTGVGPWTRIADVDKLAASGSAISAPGYRPGVQAWYNQFVLVDPRDARHVYLGLEEVYETVDGGATWHTIGPYWNFGLPCFVAGGPENCPKTIHPDQHAVAIASDGTLYTGDDGGVYSRPVSLHAVVRWNDLNATLHTLQYYYAGVGRTSGGDAAWGGLQDNGVSLLNPGAGTQVSPFGGDGGDVIIDPRNADRAVVEYVDLATALTTNGGRSTGQQVWRLISPACEWYGDLPGCDPNPRFIAPIRADVGNVDHWVIGGEFVWDNGGKGWDTVCDSAAKHCDWTAVHDTGDGNTTTAIAVNGSVTYAGWCGGGCNPGPAFATGIDTNYGGTWHTVSAPNLPQRYINNIVVDKADPAHVLAVYGAFSRRWIPGGGVGHVFESHDGGASWADISGNLPDAPADDAVLWDGKLVVATDVGMFVTDQRHPGAWKRFGSGLPNVAINDLTLSPDRSYLVAATHGRGLWAIRRP